MKLIVRPEQFAVPPTRQQKRSQRWQQVGGAAVMLIRMAVLLPLVLRPPRPDFVVPSTAVLILSIFILFPLVLLNVGEYAAAVPQFDRAVALDSQFVQAYRRRADAWMSLGEYAAAIAYDHTLLAPQAKRRNTPPGSGIDPYFANPQVTFALPNNLILCHDNGHIFFGSCSVDPHCEILHNTAEL